jgi:hypothetical protein
MAFSEVTIAEAKILAGGACQCEMAVCGHHGKCWKPLGANWRAHHRTSVATGGSDELSNCQPMCPSCYENTRTLGR